MTYNPQNLNQCEIEKVRNPRKFIDGIMTSVGLIAAVSSVPQVIKIWQSGDVSGISLLTQLIALTALITWFFYGVYIKNKPLIITSSISAVILTVVVIQIITYT